MTGVDVGVSANEQARTTAHRKDGRAILRRLFRGDQVADPYPLYARLRTTTPILPFRLPNIPRGHLLTTYADSDRLLRDPRMITLPPESMDRTMAGWREDPFSSAAYRSTLFTSGDTHRRLRSLVGSHFTPPTAERHRAAVGRIADALLDDLAVASADGGPVDLVARLAEPYVSRVAGLVLGLDDDVAPKLGDLVRRCGNILELAACPRDFQDEGAELLRLLTAIAAERRRDPRPDPVTRIAEHFAPGDGDLLPSLVPLLVGGMDAPARMVGLGCRLLMTHPGQRDLLRANPGLAKNAAAEIMRYDPAVQIIPRRVTEPGVFAGVRVVPGDVLVAAVGAAHRDPAHVDDPDRFDVGRPVVPNLGFSGGAHYCLGAAVGSLLAEELFPRLVRRFPGLAPGGEAVFKMPGTTLRGVTSLPARLRS